MTTLLFTIGGFLLGVATTVLAVVWLNRRAEQEAFRGFWGA